MFIVLRVCWASWTYRSLCTKYGTFPAIISASFSLLLPFMCILLCLLVSYVSLRFSSLFIIFPLFLDYIISTSRCFKLLTLSLPAQMSCWNSLVSFSSLLYFLTPEFPFGSFYSFYLFILLLFSILQDIAIIPFFLSLKIVSVPSLGTVIMIALKSLPVKSSWAPS